jgi:hypothetical protein
MWANPQIEVGWGLLFHASLARKLAGTLLSSYDPTHPQDHRGRSLSPH